LAKNVGRLTRQEAKEERARLTREQKATPAKSWEPPPLPARSSRRKAEERV
jgi:hypothetical protein